MILFSTPLTTGTRPLAVVILFRYYHLYLKCETRKFSGKQVTWIYVSAHSLGCGNFVDFSYNNRMQKHILPRKNARRRRTWEEYCIQFSDWKERRAKQPNCEYFSHQFAVRRSVIKKTGVIGLQRMCYRQSFRTGDVEKRILAILMLIREEPLCTLSGNVYSDYTWHFKACPQTKNARIVARRKAGTSTSCEGVWWWMVDEQQWGKGRCSGAHGELFEFLAVSRGH